MSEAIVDWAPAGRDVPAGPLLVRAPVTSAGGWHYYVAEWDGAVWRLNGAPGICVYHISDWARIMEAEDAVDGEGRTASHEEG